MAAGEALSTRKARVQAHLAELLLGDLLQAALLQKKLGSAALGVFCLGFFFQRLEQTDAGLRDGHPTLCNNAGD